jgi:succinate dehydrogenase/fumarate reductase flavoprotein subunit
MRNMVDVAEAVTRSALYRKESRGAHYRIDYPEKNDERWRLAIRVFGRPGYLEVDERTLPQPAGVRDVWR